MITNITILSNGSIAPNKTIALGRKYDNNLDSLMFDIPVIYQGFHYYLAFYMKKKPTILLPVNYNSDLKLEFFITSTVTQYAGQYEIIFLATKDAVVDGNIDNAQKVFTSTTIYGVVEDSPLEDPVVDLPLDANLQIIYEELYRLRDEVVEDLEEDAYRGAVYIPNVDEDGVITWTRSDGQNISIPEARNITGPAGAYYVPSISDEGNLQWLPSQEGVPTVKDTDIKQMVVDETDSYAEKRLPELTNDYLDANLKPAVNEAVDAKFKFAWDDENQILYITTEDYKEDDE